MGIERVMASAKLDPENARFLDEVAAELRPFDISQSSLLNLFVRIVRTQVAKGHLSLEPRALQELLRIDCVPGTAGRRDKR